MDNKPSITFENLHLVLDRKYFFTKERFYHHFSILGCKDDDIKKYWDILERFPHFGTDDIAKVGFVVENIMAYPYPSKYRAKNTSYKPRENKKKVYYTSEGEIKSLEFDLNEEKDIILYAYFLEKGYEIIVAVDLIESFYDRSKTWFIYDGDIFITKEQWHPRDDEVYVCTKDGYRKLLYTKSKGYVRNGKPDYDNREYNRHVLTMKKEYRCVGNVYVDLSFLIDKSEKQENEDVE